MASAVTCDLPPRIQNVTLIDVRATEANVSWRLESVSDSILESYYELELSYKPLGELNQMLMYHLSKFESFAMVRNLAPKTDYLLSIWTANGCGQTVPAFTKFHTPSKTLDPTVHNLMSHELVLTAIVISLWLMIIRYFFQTYGDVSFVNAASYGGYSTTKYSYNPENASQASESDSNPPPPTLPCGLLDVPDDKDVYMSRMSLLINPAMNRLNSLNQRPPNKFSTNSTKVSSKWSSLTHLNREQSQKRSKVTKLRHSKSDAEVTVSFARKARSIKHVVNFLRVPRKHSQKRRDEYKQPQTSKTSAGTSSFESAVESLEPAPAVFFYA